jgi:hypothetical protein
MLQGILDFLRARTVEYGGIEPYLQRVKEQPLDAMDFLQNVVMARHKYEIARQNVKDTEHGTIKACHTTRILIIVTIAVVLLVILAYVIGQWRLYQGHDVRWWIRTIALTAGILAGVSILLKLVFQSLEDTIADANATLSARYDGETFFDPFENDKAIAVYYATSLTKDSAQTQNHASIADTYRSLTVVEDGKKKKRVALRIEDVLASKAKGINWSEIVDACTPLYLMKVKENVPQKQDDVKMTKSTYQTQLELQELSNAEEALNEWNIHYVYSQLSLKAARLYDLVRKPEDGSDVAEIDDVIANQIVPLFMVDQQVYEIKDMILMDPTAVGSSMGNTNINTDQGMHCETKAEALMHLIELSDKPTTSMLQFSSKERKCRVFGGNLPNGTTFVRELGSSVMFRVNSVDDANALKETLVFVSGAPLDEKQFKIIQTKASSADTSRNECLKNDACIAVYDVNANEVPNLIQGVARLTSLPPQGSGAQFKIMMSSLLERIDTTTFTAATIEDVKARLLEISESFNFTVEFMPLAEGVKSRLETIVPDGNVDIIMNKVYEAFEEVDEKIKEKGTLTNVRFMSKSLFLQKADALTLEHIIDIKVNVLQRLHRLASLLQTRVQTDVVNQGSEDDNTFIAQQRTLRNAQDISNIVAIALVTTYVVYITYWSEKKIDPSTNVQVRPTIDTKQQGIGERSLLHAHEVIINAVLPLAVIVVTIALLNSYVTKKQASFQYNREVLETNTAKLIGSLFVTSRAFEETIVQLKAKADVRPTSTMRSLGVTRKAKVELYEDIVASVTLLDRCNLITHELRDMPFPITDVAVNSAAIILLSIVLVMVVMNIRNSETVGHTIVLRKIIAEVQEFPGRYKLSDFPELDCETEAVVTLKVTTAAMFVVMCIYFTKHLILYPSSYKKGLYISKYYADGRCVKT